MTLHDVATVSGVTEACRYNDHTMCNNPACSCDCHVKAKQAQTPQTSMVEPQPEKSCPKCGSKRPFNEIYCRIDGERLSSLLCPVCGAGKEPNDLFCWRCGASKDAKASTVTASSVAKEEELAVDYAKQVLAGVQRELGVATENTNEPQKVVEQVGGTQGKFTLVSKANPNKVRVPQRAAPTVEGDSQSAQVPRPRIRLPIKPS